MLERQTERRPQVKAIGESDMNSGEHQVSSPFHAGEQAVQTRLGVREQIEKMGRRMVLNHLPEQHQRFYRSLPFLLIGTTDAQGRPWASLLAGKPGFMTSPNAYALKVAARPLFGSPLADGLSVGAEVGLLGILPESRRRNRLAGRVAAMDADSITIEVAQAFGNCPQYIQTRRIEVLPEVAEPWREKVIEQGDRLNEKAQALIQKSDTMFIATAYKDESGRNSKANPAFSADISHRGGKPGFVRVEDEQTLLFPDFSGNDIFNTIGNILVNPRAGLLFIDFETRDLLYLTGRAEIVWEGSAVEAFEGAERFVRCRVESWRRVERSLPLKFEFGEYSPNLKRTGLWA